MTIECVIPVYNEECRLERCVRSLERVLVEEGRWNWQVAIADNGSRDATLRMAEELCLARPWLRVCHPIRHSRPAPEKSKNGQILRYHVEPDLDHSVYLMRYVYEHREEARIKGSRASQVAHRDWTWRNAALRLYSALAIPCVG